MIKDVSVYFDKTMQGLKHQDPEFAEALEKWKMLFCNLSNKGAYLTQVDVEDFSQDLFKAACLANSSYKLDLYRFKGRLYELVNEGEFYCTIKSLRYNMKIKKSFVTSKSKLEKVKKGKLSSVIYTALYQEYCDILGKFFRSKNGFVKTGEKTSLVPVRSKADRKCELRSIDTMERNVSLVSMNETFDENEQLTFEERLYSDFDFNKFDLCSDINTVCTDLSEEAQDLLKVLISEPNRTLRSISKELETPFQDLLEHKEEIAEALSGIEGFQNKSRFR